ncbi:zinc finger BED domain-containing 4-like [Solea senegalensis]|uniref:Zinc finger BED domain-containing 4-like n=1 Tax=Solea senegalensis TaxID=28829 RepID=A0AAV6SA51_SOLSE|nr:zinc finger BED domain-containing 4-like [Solea senegalensis]
MAITQVQCLICSRELVYGNNTSSMLRHLRAKHEDAATSQPSTSAEAHPADSSVSRKQQLDEALLNLVIVDTQPLSVVENEGFRAFVHLLDPTYTIPGRKALKRMEEKYKIRKKQAVAEVAKASTICLTADMWTSINMDAYLAVTGHFVTEEVQLKTVLLGVKQFPRSHTAAHIAEAKATVMAEWGIRAKVRCLVTDTAPNTIACANILMPQRKGRVSGSKVIPMVKMLKHKAVRQCASVTHHIASNLVHNINTNLQEKCAMLEKVTSLTLSTLLAPRFKEVGFCSSTSCQAAVERLTRECANIMPAPALPLPPAEGPPPVQNNSLWDLLDSHVDAQPPSNCTASAIAEVQR